MRFLSIISDNGYLYIFARIGCSLIGNKLSGRENLYFENVYQAAKYWTDNYARIWSSFADNTIAATRLAYNIAFAYVKTYNTTMQQIKTRSEGFSKVETKTARAPEKMPMSMSSYNASGSGWDVDHIYTVSRVVPSGYSSEGHAGYVFTTPTPDTIPLYRFYNGSISDHYYNTYPDVPPGYAPQGIEGHVVARAAPDRTPLYRFYKPKKYDIDPMGSYVEIEGTDRYFYSTSPAIPPGYTFQGIEGYVATTSGQDKKQLHRFYNPKTDDHFYSTDAAAPSYYVDETSEDPNMFVFTTPSSDRIPLHRGYTSSTHFYTVSSAFPSGYVEDRVEGFVFASAAPNMTPLYRFYSDSASDHYYNTSPAVPPGYAFEGHTGYVVAGAAPDRTPFYRFYKPRQYGYNSETDSYEYLAGTDRYFYSTSPVAPPGYTFQGIEGYVATIDGLDRTQLHRFRSDKYDDHFYSTDAAAPSDYVDETSEDPNMFVFLSPGADRAALNHAFNGHSHFYGITGNPDGYSPSPEWFTGFVFLNAGPNMTPLYQYSYAREVEEDGLFDDIGDFFSDVVNGVAGVVTTVINAVEETVDSTVGWLVNYVSAIVEEYILAIPGFGRFWGWIVHGLQEIINFSTNAPDFILSYIGIRPEKKLKLLVIIQRDAQGVPVAKTETVRSYVQHAINIFKNEANVRILPSGPFIYSSPVDDTPKAIDKYIYIESERSDYDTLNVSCGTAAGGEDLGWSGSKFQKKMAKYDTSGAGRRVIGVGSSVCAFSVQNFLDGKGGCSIGPLSDYITILFRDSHADLSTAITMGVITEDEINKGRRIATTLAHELGHACNLSHKEFYVGEDVDIDNLMYPGERGRPRGTSLSSLQISILRSSRHVTY